MWEKSAGLSRVRESCAEAIGSGLKSWSTSKLREGDTRFCGIWEVVRHIPGWFEEINAAAIFKVLAEVKPQRVVEIGSYMGRSTVFFGLSLLTLQNGGRVTAIDPHSGDRQQREKFGMAKIPSFEVFRTHIRIAGVEQAIDPILATSTEVAKSWTEPFEFLFVDGWHSYDAVLADGREWVPKMAEGGVAVFDDALQYEEVRHAIADLNREGTINLWGHFWGQAYAGRSHTPPRSVQELLVAGRGEKLAHWANGLKFHDSERKPAVG